MGFWLPFLGGAALTTAGGLISGMQSSRASKRADSRTNALLAQAMKNPSGYFGSVPEIPEYIPVDLTQSMMDTVGGNLKVLPKAAELARKASEENVAVDLERARQILPGFDQLMATNAQNALMMSQGQMPFSDVMGITGNRAALSSRLGTAGSGTAQNATLRDLGIGRMQAMGQGQNMFQSLMNMSAQAISPLSRQIGVQYSMIDAPTRANMDIQQRNLQHGSQVQGALARAMPDPALSQSLMMQMQQAQASPYGGVDWGSMLGNVASMGMNAYAMNQANVQQRIQTNDYHRALQNLRGSTPSMPAPIF